jgi:monovalent cation:H+ antiporter-2, CPA2 family
MELSVYANLIGLLLFAVVGGSLARFLKIQPLIGYILFGILYRLIFPQNIILIGKVAEIGLVFLLFSVGIELSLSKLTRVFKVAFFGGLIQVILTTILGFIVLRLFGVNVNTSFILSFGFSISSTAIIIKTLTDKNETDTLFGEVMIGWSLLQDLLVVPMMVVIFAMGKGTNALGTDIVFSLVKALFAVLAVILLGRFIVPPVMHKISSFKSRELMTLAAVAFVIATAYLTSLLGVSFALGAFLAGVVISESQEKLMIFSETRPLRDIFVAVFFVSLGFLANPAVIVAKLPLILSIALFVIVVKSVITFIVNILFGYHGKTAFAVSLGLAQIGEFSFVLFSLALSLGIISEEAGTIGITTAIITLLAFPFIYAKVTPVWRYFRKVAVKYPKLGEFVSGWERNTNVQEKEYKDHIIICGYGRVGGWVGKALETAQIPFVVIDYSQEVVGRLKKGGVEVVYGDPTEIEVLEYAGLNKAKAIVLALPDRVAQEELVALVQTKAPGVKIISRVHANEDWDKLKLLKVDKIVQPEFEAAVAIVRSMLTSMGKPKEEVAERIKNLRLSRAQS